MLQWLYSLTCLELCSHLFPDNVIAYISLHACSVTQKFDSIFTSSGQELSFIMCMFVRSQNTGDLNVIDK